MLYTDEHQLFEELAVVTTVVAARQLLAVKAGAEFGRILQLARVFASSANYLLGEQVGLSFATTQGRF